MSRLAGMKAGPSSRRSGAFPFSQGRPAAFAGGSEGEWKYQGLQGGVSSISRLLLYSWQWRYLPLPHEVMRGIRYCYRADESQLSGVFHLRASMTGRWAFSAYAGSWTGRAEAITVLLRYTLNLSYSVSDRHSGHDITTSRCPSYPS